MTLSDIVFPLHIIILLYSAWNIFQADHLGFTWMTGKVATLNNADVHKYHVRVWIGLIGMIITGLLLFWPLHSYLLNRWQFIIKMTFVVALVANGFLISLVQQVATTKQYKELSFSEKLPLLISGAISTTSWIGATIAAFFIVG